MIKNPKRQTVITHLSSDRETVMNDKKIEAFLSYLSDLDINIWADGEKLHCDAPKGALTPELRTELAERKVYILQFLKKAIPEQSIIQPIPIAEEPPLSFSQQRLWFIDQLEGGKATTYNTALAMRLEGPLHRVALEQSLQEIVQRHETLHTCFSKANGHPIVQLLPVNNYQLSVINLPMSPPDEQNYKAQQVINEEAQRPFDLPKGPLFRTTLLQLDVESHILLFTIHHIIFDGWSIGVLLYELSTLYNAFSQDKPSPLVALPVQYTDFAYWQRQWLSGEVLQTQLSYWQQQLADAPYILEIPSDHPRPSVCNFQGSHEDFELGPELTQQLKSLSQQSGVTLFVLTLAAFAILMGRYSGQEDLLIGSGHANRNRTEIEPLIGFFVNTLALRIDLSGNPTFLALLERTQQVTLEGYAHQNIPFEQLVETLQPERDLTRNPLVQVSLILQNAQMSSPEMTGLTISPLEIDTGTVRFDLECHLLEVSGQLRGRCIYYKDIFEAATIVRMLGHFQILLASIATQPDQPISALSILSDVERHQLLVEWNQTQTTYPQDKCIHQLFEAQVEKTPEAIAVVFEGQQLTYLQLNTKANQLAHHLQTLGVKPEALVGICVERSLEMIIGLLGILKAGGAYVPLDPKYPPARLAFMLEDAQVQTLITQQHLLATFAKHKLSSIVCLDTDWQEAISLQSEANPKIPVTPANLAYVIYTSGSTGKPKGVAIEHHSTVVMLAWAKEVFTPAQIAGVLASTSICFDLSVFEFFVPWSWGGKVILVENALHIPTLQTDSEVTLINTVPSAMNELVKTNNIPASVRVVNLAGEPLQKTLVQQIYQQETIQQVFNLYGPSEDTTYSTFALIEKDAEESPSIGRPIANTQVYVLDRNEQPVPIGIYGELYLGGEGLARGYFNRPELTANKFIPNPFSHHLKDRLYKTGDLVRYRSDGNLEFLGRIDNQVKIRGFRIELGEIEAVLNQDSTVREAVVIAREDEPGDKRLVAYIVSKLIPDRLPIQSVCRVEFDNEQPITLSTEDISCHGVCLVGVPATCQMGQRVRLGLQLPNVSEEMWLTGSVAWCQEQRAGVQFAFANSTEQGQLCQSVEHIFKTQGFLKVIQRTSVTHLREVLKEKLPDYMVPTSFVFLSAMPLTPNGKIDRKALPKAEALRLDDEDIAPETEIEHEIATVWRNVLHINKLSKHDNFFDLGGNSLLVIQVQNQLVEVLNQEVPVVAFFQYPTIYALAHYLEDSQQEAATFQATYDHAQKVKEARHRHKKHHKKHH